MRSLQIKEAREVNNLLGDSLMDPRLCGQQAYGEFEMPKFSLDGSFELAVPKTIQHTLDSIRSST